MDTVEAPVGRREKRKQEIRARIEDAAYRLFKQQGVEETSIEQICVEADVARRTFYGHFANKHALLGGLGISRLYNRSEPMLRELMANHATTRARLEAMIDYIEANFAGYEDIDRQLILMAPSAFINDQEQKREINNSAVASFTRLIDAGLELGDVKAEVEDRDTSFDKTTTPERYLVCGKKTNKPEGAIPTKGKVKQCKKQE